MKTNKTKEYILFFSMCFLIFFGLISASASIEYSVTNGKLYLFSGIIGIGLMIYLLVISFKRFLNNTK